MHIARTIQLCAGGVQPAASGELHFSWKLLTSWESLNKFFLATNVPSGAKQAAGKGRFSSDMPERQTSGAKARRLFCCICGTTEVVPFQNSELFRSL
jgi:hypothetical protein